MALIKEVNGLKPVWGKDCYFSENATIVGEVTMGDECSIWFNAVVRGDVAPITIGNRTNVQDGACLHTTRFTGPLHIGNDVTIGHNATVHACTIHDHALIGMGSTLLDHCEVGEGSIVAAGALVVGGTKIGAGEIWGGVPAKFIQHGFFVCPYCLKQFPLSKATSCNHSSSFSTLRSPLITYCLVETFLGSHKNFE